MASIIRLVQVSDLHTGHELGLWPSADLPLPDGREIGLNDFQRYTLECWRHLTKTLQELKPDILVVNGDVLDGEGRKSGAQEQTTAMMGVQVKAATKLLRPIAQAAKEVYLLRGTPYHDGLRGLVCEPVGAALGAIGPNPEWHSWSVLDLDIQGVVVNVQHAVSIATGFYRATPLDREGIWSALAGKENKVPRADLVMRAHAHVFVHVEHPTKHIVIGPAWQGQTEYMRRHSAYRMLPDIGCLVVDIDPAAKKRGEDPITVKKILYNLPEIKAVKSRV